MKKFGIWTVILSFIMFMTPLGASSNALYTVDENGNWIPVQQTTTVQQTTPAQTYNTSTYTTNPVYSQNTTYNTGSYSTNTYNKIPDANNVPYSIQVQKTQKRPVNANMSTVDLNNLVNQIGDKIVSKNRINKRVSFIVNSAKTINATTGLANNITVYKGLIEYCEDEDELAFVIGHELGHATSSHLLKTYGVNITTGLAGEIAKNKLAEKIGSKWGRWATNIAID